MAKAALIVIDVINTYDHDDSTNVRQAMRGVTSRAASSGPCPETSPTIACTVPSAHCTMS